MPAGIGIIGGWIGGIAGGIEGGSIKRCAFNGTVFGPGHVGGIAGYSDSIIEDCLSSGTVTLNDLEDNTWGGGILGENSAGSVIESYACGAVISSNSFHTAGGLVGLDWSGTMTRSYWDTEATGMSTSAGSNVSFGKTTSEMKQQSTYTDWDFETVWNIEEAVSYPSLQIVEYD